MPEEYVLSVWLGDIRYGATVSAQTLDDFRTELETPNGQTWIILHTLLDDAARTPAQLGLDKERISSWEAWSNK